MFIEDHEVAGGGYPKGITVRLLPAEVDLLLFGNTLTGANLHGRGTRVRVQAHPMPTEAFDCNSSGYLWLRINLKELQIVHGQPMLTVLRLQSSEISQVVVLVDPKGYVQFES